MHGEIMTINTIKPVGDMSSNNSPVPVFRPLRAQTPCYWCEHVRGHAAPEAKWWQCAARKAVGQDFKKDPDSGSGLVETLARCPDYGRRKGDW